MKKGDSGRRKRNKVKVQPSISRYNSKINFHLSCISGPSPMLFKLAHQLSPKWIKWDREIDLFGLMTLFKKGLWGWESVCGGDWNLLPRSRSEEVARWGQTASLSSLSEGVIGLGPQHRPLKPCPLGFPPQNICFPSVCLTSTYYVLLPCYA